MADVIALLRSAATLVLQGQMPPPELLKQLLSKGLGYGIIAGSTMVKLPQVAKIMQSKSAEGLSALSFELETWVLLVHMVYGFYKGLPFSAYGEAVLLFMQTLLIVTLVYQYSGAPVWRVMTAGSVIAGCLGALASGQLGMSAISAAYDANNALVLVARVPQILKNLQERSTGQLSIVTYGIQTVGCLARIFTTQQEGGGSAMMRSYIIGFFLNLILVAQILLYSGSKQQAKRPPAKGGNQTKGGRRRQAPATPAKKAN